MIEYETFEDWLENCPDQRQRLFEAMLDERKRKITSPPIVPK